MAGKRGHAGANSRPAENPVSPTVSILVTVYNRERFLAATLDSILKSSLQDFEVIVVDDASGDGSLAIAQDYASRDRRIRVYANAENLGDYPNRMKAASLATGKYLKYVDSDDLIYPHSLAIMVDGMDACEQAGLGLSHSLPEDASPYPWVLTPEQAYKKQFLGRGCLSCGPGGAIIRRQAFEAVGGFNSDWQVISDLDLWYRLAAKWPVVLLPPGLVWWRRHEQQEFVKGQKHGFYLRKGYELTVITLQDPQAPLTSNDRASALGRARQHFARRVLALALRKQQWSLACRLKRESGLSPADLVKGFLPYQ